MEMRITPPFTAVAEIELVYRTKVKPSLRLSVCSTKQAYDVFRNHWDMDKIELQEQFKIMLLNASNKVVGLYECSCGGTMGTVVDVRLVFCCALKINAKRVILCHNHPSGNLAASQADRQLTTRMVAAGKILDIGVIDHLIITSEGFISLAEEGLL
ncbi:JAB domain-containing protein [Pedobacter sp. ISL-68]|uniref:JAB domain-containing protein n=1 Tax=unclassified Pedobacter TaxID=2628915 RepID=UPI001BEB435A|nr:MULTISPECIES: JAB domain-containing protein [unclassified Pedobacter]MBT2561323.1 JAB domain-containing protein [Pedobacter sp. ISL-64]MBT2590712.1 JAB domain-containing protein [Pedobacter sp. ISL-68]